jgi:hypothetical protein
VPELQPRQREAAERVFDAVMASGNGDKRLAGSTIK